MTNLNIPTEDLQELLDHLLNTYDHQTDGGSVTLRNGKIRLSITEYQGTIIKLLLQDALYDPSTCSVCGKHINFYDPATICDDCREEIDLAVAEAS